MERTITLGIADVLQSREAAHIAARMSRYESQILIRRGDITVNAKSLIGLTSAELLRGQTVTIVAEGQDAAQAVPELAKLLGA